MEGQRLAARIRIVAVIKQASIEEEVYMMLPVVDESEGRDAARFEPKVLHHAFWRSKRELSTRGFPLRLKCCFESSLEVVNVQIMVTMEADEVVLVAFMVSHDDVLAVNGTVLTPPTFRLFECLALFNRPKLLILDEPFNFLDPSSQNVLKHVLTEYNRETGATILISSHNLQHTVDISTRIALLEKGKIIRDLPNTDGSSRSELEDYFETEA